jgi:hypothetical protein
VCRRRSKRAWPRTFTPPRHRPLPVPTPGLCGGVTGSGVRVQMCCGRRRSFFWPTAAHCSEGAAQPVRAWIFNCWAHIAPAAAAPSSLSRASTAMSSHESTARAAAPGVTRRRNRQLRPSLTQLKSHRLGSAGSVRKCSAPLRLSVRHSSPHAMQRTRACQWSPLHCMLAAD